MNTSTWRWVFIGLVLLGRLQATAQGYGDEEQKVFNGGLILGSNFAQVDGDTYYGYHKVGLNTGATVYIHFTQSFGCSIEIIYSQKGSRGQAVTESPWVGTYVAKYFMNLNYAEIPVTLHVKYKKTDFEFGASYARLITSKEWILSDFQVAVDPVANSFNTQDINYILGLTRHIYKKLYGNFRFQYSILSIRPNERIPIDYGYGNNGQWNNLVSLRVMYMF